MRLSKYTDIYDRISGSLSVLAAIFIVIAMLIVSLDVVMRYFLNRPQLWVAESTEYILVWFTFLAAAWILKKERHVKVEIVANRLNPRAKALLGIIVSIIGALICLLVVIYGTQVVWDSFQRHVRMETTLGLPKAPLVIVIPIGSSLLFIQFLRRSYGYFEHWQKLSSKE
ncbi:TRAP transporter small permease subunit [Chloroflexota bacterium]